MSHGNSPSKSVVGNIKFCGILTILLGVVSLLTPLLVGMSIVVFVGILVLLAGLFRLIGALAFYKLEQGLISLLLGVLTLVCGLIMVTDPLFASGVITVVLVIYLLLDGMLEVGALYRFAHLPDGVGCCSVGPSPCCWEYCCGVSIRSRARWPSAYCLG